MLKTTRQNLLTLGSVEILCKGMQFVIKKCFARHNLVVPSAGFQANLS